MKKYFKALVSFIIILSATSYIYGKGQSPYQIISEDYIENMESSLITYQHIVTGAQAIHLKNTDPNQVFAIGFKTPVHDNTGVNHIVEHSVFTGSEKYNLKDVFFEMKKKSPNIFMNASTAADMTIYPFSTRNHKDYQNLLDVYLDAVFFPNLQKHPYGFQQEGGVVYNEMKGASVAPKRILAMTNRAVMFPDTMYIYNAGGDPAEIPDLTYEAFKETHKEYYVPSNSCAFIYGDVDIDLVLDKLDHYYSQFKKTAHQNISQKQKAFKEIKYYTDYYPSAHEKDDCYVSTNFVVGEIQDIKLQFSMGILMDILTKYEQSPLRKAFRENPSGKTLSYDIDGAIPQPMYSIIATDVEEKNIEPLEILIKETLQKAAQEGFEKDLIQMAINNYEINTKQQTSNLSKGVDMAYSSLYSWGHGLSPLLNLQREKLIEDIKKEGDSLYFQELVKEHLLGNNHQSQVVLLPDQNYIAKKQAHAKDFIVEDQGKLKNWQESLGSVKDLPELSLNDINQAAPLPQLKIKKDKNSHKMYYLADTKGLVYMDLYFDTSYIPQESLNELFLFTHLISQKEKDLAALYTGGVGTSAIAIPKYEWYNEYEPKLKISLCVEKDNLSKGFEILNQIGHDNRWDEDWVLMQVRKIRSYYESYLNTSPLDIMNLAVGNTQKEVSRYEYEKVIPFYQYICQIEDHYDQYQEQITRKLKIINQSIFNKNKLVLGATLEEQNIKQFEKSYKKYTKQLSGQNYPKIDYQFDMQEKRQGFPIASDVQYIVWGGNYKEKAGTYNGALYVLGNILNAQYLLPNIRVANGAYGAGIKFNPYGKMNIYTYQDPQLAKSLETIEEIPSYIEGLNMDDHLLEEYKIGAFSKFEQELGLNDHPSLIGERLQHYHLAGLTDETLEKVKEEIFQTTISDIKNQGLILEKLIKDKRYSIAANKSKLLTNTRHFDIIQSFHH